MKKKNCWEHMKCGCDPGGQKSPGADVCPASAYIDLDGVHGGMNAGRACWAIDDTLCPTITETRSARKFSGCWKCDFYHLVRHEESSSPHGFLATYLEMRKMLKER